MRSQSEYHSFGTIYGYHPTLVRRRKRNFPAIFVLFTFIGTATLLAFVLFTFVSNSSAGIIISPLADTPEALASTLSPTNTPTSASLAQLINTNLADKKGTYSFVVKNLSTGEEFFQNEHEVFESASLYKLWVMAVVYDQIKNGKIALDDVLSEEIPILNDRFKIASDAAELKEGEITMSVEKALEQMITISHNYAALLLANKVRLATVTNFLKNHGFNESKTGSPPRTSAYDIALFYEKLYDGEIVSDVYSEKMLELLSRQKLNDRIPKYLPTGTRVAHKTGELSEVKHDAGIVFSDKGDYIFVVLTKSKNPADAAETTALISKSVYEYFNKQ